MSNKFSLKQVKDITLLIGGLGSDSIVAKTASTSRKKPKPGESTELTRFMLAPGAWIIAGQASFAVDGATDTAIEYQLSLGYANGTTGIGGRHAYMRIQGLVSGSPMVIDAVTFDEVTTVRLLYATELFREDPTSIMPSTDVRDQILIAIKTPNLLNFEP